MQIESKDHKWSDAPILGMQDNDVGELQPITAVPEAICEQGKVIKVVNGKSTTVAPPKPLKASTVTGSHTPQTMTATKRKG